MEGGIRNQEGTRYREERLEKVRRKHGRGGVATPPPSAGASKWKMWRLEFLLIGPHFVELERV